MSPLEKRMILLANFNIPLVLGSESDVAVVGITCEVSTDGDSDALTDSDGLELESG